MSMLRWMAAAALVALIAAPTVLADPGCQQPPCGNGAGNGGNGNPGNGNGNGGSGNGTASSSGNSTSTPQSSNSTSAPSNSTSEGGAEAQSQPPGAQEGVQPRSCPPVVFTGGKPRIAIDPVLNVFRVYPECVIIVGKPHIR